MSVVNLVTGDHGFIAGALVNLLRWQKETVCGLDMLSDYPTVDVLTDFLETRKVKRIYHLGARAFIPECYGMNILPVLQSNTTFTANLLVAAHKAGIDKFLYFSTSEVYGSPEYIPIDESHRVSPQSTYAATKLAAENLCRTFGVETGLNVVILRHFNIYGPNDTHPRIVPKIIRAAAKRIHLELGDPRITRDLTLVDDACTVAHLLMHADTKNGEIYNSGTGQDTSIEDLATMIYEISGNDNQDITWNVVERPWDILELQCDNRKIKKMFPELEYTDLSRGLADTVEWYQIAGSWRWEREQTRK